MMLCDLTSLISGIYPLIRKWQHFDKGNAVNFFFFKNIFVRLGAICGQLTLRAIQLIRCEFPSCIMNVVPTPSPRAWVSNNVEGSYKRSVSLAMVISL